MLNFLFFLKSFLKSTIFVKVVMAATGLVIVGFLFGHALGNLQFFLGAEPYNTYAAFLQSPLGLVEILWLVRAFLVLCIILHIISAIYLRLYNNAAKPEHYEVKNYVKAKLTSRTMLWTGLLIAAGLTYHLLHFTTGDIDFAGGYDSYEIVPTGEYAICADNNTCDISSSCSSSNTCSSSNSSSSDCPMAKECNASSSSCSSSNSSSSDCSMAKECNASSSSCSSSNTCSSSNSSSSACPMAKECNSECSSSNCHDNSLAPVVKERHDVYTMVVTEFGNPIVALSYIIFVILVGFHLNHAIQSALHTLGVQGPKLTPILNKLSVLLSVALVLLFTVLPISVILGLAGGCC